MKFIIDDEEHIDTRLDAYLSSLSDLGLSRSYIKKLIDSENVSVNGKLAKASYKLRSDDEIEIEVPEAVPLNIVAENIPLDIVYEDDELIVINKPINMVTHPAPGAYSGTLVNAVMYHVQANSSKLSDINGVLRPGIVHRLDKDTSGLIVVAKSNAAHASLSEQIQDRTCKRLYKALVHENIKEDRGTIDKPIGRNPTERHKMAVLSLGANGTREARTHFTVLERFKFTHKSFTLVECQLDTGRTHQIRVHMSWMKHPILGDTTYLANKNSPFNISRPMLHAYKLSFKHPISGQDLSFEAAIPEDMQRVLDVLRTQGVE